MRKFKFPLWLQRKLLPFFDDNTMPVHLRGENLFAMMFNQKLHSVVLNKEDITITTVYQDGTKGLIVHSLDTDQYLGLWARVINKMHMDLTVIGHQENTVTNMVIRGDVSPCDFCCTQDRKTLTLTATPHG